MGQRFDPANAAELLDVVRWALSETAPLEVVGQGTKRGIGRPVEAQNVLSAAGLSGIAAYEPTELYLTAAAGTPLREIDEALAHNAQQLAFEPRDLRRALAVDGEQTIGGVVAAALSGPRRFVAGAVRDHVLGFRAVSGRGEAFKSGGNVVKNVTGYDLSKLIAGSFGTLAVMTEVTVRVAPVAQEVASLVVSDVAAADLSALFEPAAQTGSASGCVLLSSTCAAGLDLGAGPALVLRFEGDNGRAAAAEAMGKIAGRPTRLVEAEESRKLWRGLRDLQPLASRSGSLWRVALPRTALDAFLATAAIDDYLVDWAGRQVWLVAPSEITDVRGALNRAAGSDGHATLIRADENSRRSTSEFQPQAAALVALTASVRRQFDPKGILNPGRMGHDV